MGSSEWDYVEPFGTDLPTTPANLRRRVFDGRDYFWHESIPRPGTLADLERIGEGKWIEIESRWTGVCVPLHDESGTVIEVAFWGCSGD